MHRDLQAVAVDVHVEIVIIHLLALKWIAGRAFDWIGVRSSAAGYKVRNSAVFMPFVIVDVSGNNHNPRPLFLLPRFEHFREYLLLGTRRMSSAKRFHIGGTRVGRMMKKNENEIDISGKVI